MYWLAQAPSNIALIKYMGKRFYSPLPVCKNPKAFLKKADPGCKAGSVRGDEPYTQSVEAEVALEETVFAPCFLKGLCDEERSFLRFSNLSVNASLSYTLSHFQTVVRIEPSDQDQWRPFRRDPFHAQKRFDSSKKMGFEKYLSQKARKKFMDFFGLLKRFFDLPGHYTVFSESNFPLGAGLASSAASFSALTKAAFRLAWDRSPFKSELRAWSEEDLSCLSRAGSGSSSRSLFSPWAFWEGQGAVAFKAPWPYLIHQLVLIDPKEKSTSSTEAHQRVTSSPLFKGRVNRATERLESLREAFRKRDWQQGFRVCFDEFLDLHSLFSTAQPPFKYTNPAVEKALSVLTDFWKKEADGPWITMDAGANIHLLYRPDQKAQSLQIQALLGGDHPILSPL